jgi:hypothetical protein
MQRLTGPLGMALDPGGGQFAVQDEAERPLLSLP